MGAGLPFALFAALAGFPPGDGPRGITVSAWIPTSWDYAGARASLDLAAGKLDMLSPVWFRVAADGGVVARLPGGAHAPLPGPSEADLKAFCRLHRVALVPLISNSAPGRGFDPDRVSLILNSRSLRAAHVAALAGLVVERGYDGIEIDYEMLKPGDRDAFTRFTAELGDALRANGKRLAVAVHAKTAEPGGAWGPRAHDYAALGRIVDSFRIMTYDRHWRTGPAGPVAPLPWFEEVLRFAVSRVPSGKVLMGIPTYGYDWSGTNTGRSRDVTARAAGALARERGAEVEWDEASGSPHFSYPEEGRRRQVWYEDARCLKPKLAAVRRAGAGGVAIWRLGAEEPEFWRQLR